MVNGGDGRVGGRRILWEGGYTNNGDIKVNQSKRDMEEHMLSERDQQLVAQIGGQGEAVQLGWGQKRK